MSIVALIALCSACRSPGLSCVDLVAAATLNLHEGQPHAAVVYVYPLSSSGAFEQAASEDLLRGLRPEGALSPEPWRFSILPGERRPVSERFAPETRSLGVLVDLYVPHGAQPRTRKLVVSGRCGPFRWRAPEIAIDPAPEAASR